ncbi:SRPBCC family protein [Parasphingopyxis marina]|uniref:SRPBCC domain-containing protein n=1 Tax=Parasphingopyxis marina TaxID=2761622 RepID=A0A842I2U8_9SPHN|nr:SRPBCC family protein [Parasphingopyxis marina]MBC2779103.1 SRPBCC domain-containing protein [Parasphingopyxis marina]
MDLKFRVAARIAAPVDEVFEAVADPDKLSHYFTTGGAKGRIETGATVTWDFHDYPGAFPVDVVEVVKNEKIVLQWQATEGEAPNLDGGDMKEVDYKTTVTMSFTALDDGRTLLEIKEEGWRENQGALDASYGNCQGWAQMLCALKAWVEHGLNLREGMYK